MAMMDWNGWQAQEKAVLLFLRDGPNLLLIHKKRGLGTGKVNGPGGRVEPGESWEAAAVRETREETGLTPLRTTLAATIKFQFVTGYSLDVRAFTAEGWTGLLTACDEADPFWHPVQSLPWSRMWADDALWLPPVLEGRKVEARFLFDGESMRESEIDVDRPGGPLVG